MPIRMSQTLLALAGSSINASAAGISTTAATLRSRPPSQGEQLRESGTTGAQEGRRDEQQQWIRGGRRQQGVPGGRGRYCQESGQPCRRFVVPAPQRYSDEDAAEGDGRDEDADSKDDNRARSAPNNTR
jgi:hypothetical protein